MGSKTRNQKIKSCPFRVHGVRISSLTVEGEYSYTERFALCMRSACAAYKDGQCMRLNTRVFGKEEEDV